MKEEVPMPRFYINQDGSKYSEFLSSPLAPNLLFQTIILTLLNFCFFAGFAAYRFVTQRMEVLPGHRSMSVCTSIANYRLMMDSKTKPSILRIKE
jgi:hypothetical protein